VTQVKRKSEIVTFKVDDSLLEAMKGIPNRSDFIRSAVISALEGGCPLCQGTGILTPKQREHWNSFTRDHSFVECGECHEIHLVCAKNPVKKAKHRSNKKKSGRGK
jgi:hypothetical protein